MAKSKYQFNWKAWVFGGLSVVLTGLSAMFPVQSKALGTKILEHWDWIGPLLATVVFVVFLAFVSRELCRARRAGNKTSRGLRRMSRRVQQMESQLRDQTTRIGAAVDRIETLERKIFKSDD